MLPYTDGAPIYAQIIARIKADIATGALSPGSRLPSVRDAAVEHRVNPNTMYRVMTELEREGFIQAERGVGYFVVDDPTLTDALRRDEASKAAAAFLARMDELGLSPDEIEALLHSLLKGGTP